MQKNYLSLILFIALSLTIQAQAPRKVLIERFTNASCGPCAVYGPAFEALIDSYGSSLVQLNYQCSFPGVDPMNAQNSGEVSGRYNAFYPAVPTTGIPYCALDGSKYNGHIANLPAATIASRINTESPLELTVAHSISVNFDSATITVNLKNVSAAAIPSANNALYLALTEKEIIFAAPPGTNGETEFRAVMRKMIPNINGTPFTADLMPGEEKSFEFKVAIPKYIYHYGRIGAVAFVQNKTTKEIFQSAESEPLGLTGNYVDLELEATSDARNDFCDNNVTLELEIINSSSLTEPITSIKFIPYFGTIARPKLTWTGSLEKGQKTTFTVNNFNLANGLQKFYVTIDSVNDGKAVDVNKRNNNSDVIKFLTIPAVIARDTMLNQTFGTAAGVIPAKMYADITSPMRIFSVTKANAGNPPDETGGFGLSPASLFFDLNVPPPGISSSLYFAKLNLSNSKRTTMDYSWAHARANDNVTNMLQVYVSADCGTTFTLVSEKRDADLATTDNIDPAGLFFIPLASQWKKETVNISQFDNTAELLIKVVVTSGGGQSLFFDDLKVYSAPPVGVEENYNISLLQITPNPVQHSIHIDLKLDQADLINAEIYSSTGNKIGTIFSNLALSEGSHNLDFSVENLASGSYQLFVKGQKGTTVRRFIKI